MSMKEALEKTNGIRLSYGSKWMVCNNGTLTVYSREYGQKKTRTVLITESETDALSALVQD